MGAVTDTLPTNAGVAERRTPVANKLAMATFKVAVLISCFTSLSFICSSFRRCCISKRGCVLDRTDNLSR